MTTAGDDKKDSQDSLYNNMNQIRRIRDQLTAAQTERFISALAIARQRAIERHAPQEVVITDKGYARFIDPSDHSGPVE